jgi:flagellin-like protein
MLKKAISPLIATVMLIAFTMVLGAIVMNFTHQSTTELTETTSNRIERGLKCSLDLSIRVLEIGGQVFACYNRSGSDNFEIVVENQGSQSAEGVRIFLLDYNENPKTADVFRSLGAHNRTKYNISASLTDANTQFTFPPTKVLVSPIIEHGSNSVDICTDNRIDLDEVEECD